MKVRPPENVIACPIAASLGVLGRKWTLLLLRDAVLVGERRFGGFLRNNPKMTPRMLSRRLRELVDEGFLTREEEGDRVRYLPTAKGTATEPILLAFTEFGASHMAERVFTDGRTRDGREYLGMLGITGAGLSSG